MVSIEQLKEAVKTHQPETYFREGAEGLRHENPIKSKTWITLLGFMTKKEAQEAAKVMGWQAQDVVRLYGRFEYKWCIGGVHQQTALKPEHWKPRQPSAE